MNDSIIEAVSFFRKACVEYGADKSLDNANMVFEEQKNLFSAIRQALQPPAEERRGTASHHGYAAGDVVTRGSDDLHIVTSIDDDRTGTFLCIRAPADGWCQKGDKESNLLRRYSLVSPFSRWSTA